LYNQKNIDFHAGWKCLSLFNFIIRFLVAWNSLAQVITKIQEQETNIVIQNNLTQT